MEAMEAGAEPAWLHHIQSHLNWTEAFKGELGESSGRAASLGCSDIFSAFAFLAFLFALLNFLLGMTNKRKRRSVDSCGLESLSPPRGKLEREGGLAVLLLYRLYQQLQEVEAEQEQCGQRMVCSAVQRAAGLGRLPTLIATIGTVRMRLWLRTSLSEIIEGSAAAGLQGGDCEVLYQCELETRHFQHPWSLSQTFM